MLTNYHTHSTFCDGKNTPEEVVRAAIEAGFDALGFSGHGYTAYDERSCMIDTDGYIAEVRRLQKEYFDTIQIYLGVEEDSYSILDRSRFDYIIGSSHYVAIDGEYVSIDSTLSYIHKALEHFDNSIERLAEAYYAPFCSYIASRKPDIVGHFDLITKFDERDSNRLLSDAGYLKTAEAYMELAAQNDVLFEVNTGAVARGYRHDPYPHERLLHVLKRHDAKLVLSSDSHRISTLSFGFEEAKALLRDVGFDGVYVLYDGRWRKEAI